MIWRQIQQAEPSRRLWLTSVKPVRSPYLPGLHFASLEKAAETLAKKGLIALKVVPREGTFLTLKQERKKMESRTTMAMEEQLKLMGIGPRYSWSLEEASTTHPSSPEDDQDLAATPKPDKGEPPNTTKAGMVKHWDMYRGLQERAKKMAELTHQMWEGMGKLQESEMSKESRQAYKMARQAVREAWSAHATAYKAISAFGGTLLDS